MNSSRLNKTIKIAKIAGKIIRDHWQRPHDVHYKRRIDLSNKTDTVVEAYLTERLNTLLPGVGFIGEASSHSLIPEGDCWIVDPLDGITNLVHDIPFVAVSAALWQGGSIRLGAVAPNADEHFLLKKDSAHCNGQPLQASKIARCEQGLIATGFPL